MHDPPDPIGRLLFNVLAMVAEFESDLIRARTREGMQVAKAKGLLRGKQPKLSNAQQRRPLHRLPNSVLRLRLDRVYLFGESEENHDQALDFDQLRGTQFSCVPDDICTAHGRHLIDHQAAVVF